MQSIRFGRLERIPVLRDESHIECGSKENASTVHVFFVVDIVEFPRLPDEIQAIREKVFPRDVSHGVSS
jgi:hypothetical protein